MREAHVEFSAQESEEAFRVRLSFVVRVDGLTTRFESDLEATVPDGRSFHGPLDGTWLAFPAGAPPFLRSEAMETLYRIAINRIANEILLGSRRTPGGPAAALALVQALVSSFMEEALGAFDREEALEEGGPTTLGLHVPKLDR